MDPAAALYVLVEDFEEDETPLQAELEARIIARVCKRAAVKAGKVCQMKNSATCWLFWKPAVLQRGMCRRLYKRQSGCPICWMPVASPALKFNLDPVNFIGSVQDVYDTSRMINKLFDLLGEDTIAAHGKECGLAEAFVMQIHEVLIGTGTMNYELFLRRFLDTCPDQYFIVEHLPDEKIPLARDALKQVAARLNVVFE